MQILPTPHAMIALATIAAQMPTATLKPKPPRWRVDAAEVRMALV